MKTVRDLRILTLTIVFSVLFAGIALADSLRQVEEVDEVLAEVDPAGLALGDICPDAGTATGPVQLGIRKHGTQTSFVNDSTVQITVVTGSGQTHATLSGTTGSLTVPEDWTNNTAWPHNTIAPDTFTSTVTLTLPDPLTWTLPYSYEQKIVFRASGNLVEDNPTLIADRNVQVTATITEDACAGDEVYLTRGFYSPVSMTEMNKARGGQGVPLKFNVWEDEIDEANEITDLVLHHTEAFRVRSFQIACNSDESMGSDADIAAKGESGFRYDDTAIVEDADGQFVYVWNTLKGWDGTCRQLEVTYKGEAIEVDGSDPTMYLTAKFRFGK